MNTMHICMSMIWSMSIATVKRNRVACIVRASMSIIITTITTIMAVRRKRKKK